MTSAVAPGVLARAALVVLLAGGPAWASDVSDDVTVGAIRSNSTRTSAPFVSDRLGGAWDASDQISFSLDATYTRYFKGGGAPGENIYQLDLGTDWTPDDTWALGLDLRGSPPSTAVTPTPAGPVRSRTSLLGAGAYVEYDSAGSAPQDKSASEIPFETIVEGDVDVTSYSTTQRARSASKPTPSHLVQYALSPTVTGVIHGDTECEISGAYYLYSNDPLDTGYFGASVFGRGPVSDGLPLEPLRWSLRPTLRQKLGHAKLSAYFQYGRYVGSAGWSALGGVKAQLEISSRWRLWAGVGFQHDAESTGEQLAIPWGSLGARVAL